MNIKERLALKKAETEKKIEHEILTLSNAEIVIAGGRGMKSKENFALLYDLANLLPNAQVGGTRAAVQLGWIKKNQEIGQSSINISPRVYLAFGISGAVQHIAGIKNNPQFFAVNIDKDAPIMQKAEYKIIQDATETVKNMIQEIKSGKVYSWM